MEPRHALPRVKRLMEIKRRRVDDARRRAHGARQALEAAERDLRQREETRDIAECNLVETRWRIVSDPVLRSGAGKLRQVVSYSLDLQEVFKGERAKVSEAASRAEKAKRELEAAEAGLRAALQEQEAVKLQCEALARAARLASLRRMDGELDEHLDMQRARRGPP